MRICLDTSKYTKVGVKFKRNIGEELCYLCYLGPHARKRRNKEKINNPKNNGHLHYATSKGSPQSVRKLKKNNGKQILASTFCLPGIDCLVLGYDMNKRFWFSV